MSTLETLLAHGRRRVVIEGVKPQVDNGRFSVKRTVGDRMKVEADVFADGHDEISAWVSYRHKSERGWHELRMLSLVNDRWCAEFELNQLGRYRYTVQAWVDPFGTWRRDLKKRVAAGQDVALQFLIGAGLLEDAASNLKVAEARRLKASIEALRGEAAIDAKLLVALDDDLAALMARTPHRDRVTKFERELTVVVDRERARFSAWYEMFPRSCGNGTFRHAAKRLPYIADMGFDILYLPPVHPIGSTHRKGRNNKPTATPDEPGSPWAIGAEQGGHKAVAPQLGTLADFRAFVSSAKEHNLEIALDIAFQCSPDHPYVKEHPQWFRWRPDNTVQYAENPPKKYQDIYPLDFETADWQALWQELKSVFLFWIGQGVRVFRVDNPHTKPFRFWEWLINDIKQQYPDVLFLAEAFTRPKIMYQLAKLGFSQSYTYFTWRNESRDITEYFTELTQTEAREFFRPNPWPNTPDILHEYLQTGGRPAFIIRYILAATLGASYGIYGPAFELCEHVAREPGSEEYVDSEKYQTRDWQLNSTHSLKPLIARVNRIRRENPALQADSRLKFHTTGNDQLIAYSKSTENLDNIIVMVVNLDPHNPQTGWLHLTPKDIGQPAHAIFKAHDLLTGARYIWRGADHYVALNPHGQPAHVLSIEKLA
ncbi:MAG: alpha-1,4-glucan--maltose-1-phosphate maltosyltransferase [Gammaproteobacteria bacterium]|nr:alpha-1,4-glucan--maltose-1-phosphate maltosyltransferase [Gammaproteobacteria bacterium]